MSLRAAVIGCGRRVTPDGHVHNGMGYQHGDAFRHLGIPVVACADVQFENAGHFADAYGGKPYGDYREMLAEEQPDVVSICTWPHLHEEMTLAAVDAGVKAIHCEKPIAPTWASAKRMVAHAAEKGVQLTFNHQRRFDRPYMKIKRLIAEGAIGELRRLEMGTDNLFDWGTHWFDMMFFYLNQTPAEWVLGQVEPTGGPTVFGVTMEGQGIVRVKFENGITAIMCTQRGHGEHGLGAMHRIIGSEGFIELGARGWETLDIWNKGRTFWEDITEPSVHGPEGAITLGVADLARCLETGDEPELSARKALMATELIFASYESSRQGRRIDLPLEVSDSAVIGNA